MKDFINYLTTKAWWLLVILLPFGLIILGIKIYLDKSSQNVLQDQHEVEQADQDLAQQQNNTNDQANQLVSEVANSNPNPVPVQEDWYLKRGRK